MLHDFDLFFDTETDYWKKVLTIFEANETFPKKVVSDRNLHHKFPRSFSKKLKEPIDNDEDNLISLPLSDHFLVHYYYWKCARKGYRQPMATAFYFMSKQATRFITDETVESLAKDFADVETEAKRLMMSESRKGKKPKNFEYFLQKAHECVRKTEEEKNLTKEKYKEVLTSRRYAKRMDKPIKLMRCIEFDEVHSVIKWRSWGFRADKVENNLEYYGLHFEYINIKRKDFVETELSEKIKDYLKQLKPTKKNDYCDCCGDYVADKNHTKLIHCSSGWKTFCYRCFQTIELYNNIENKEEYNPLWVAFFSRFLILPLDNYENRFNNK